MSSLNEFRKQKIQSSEETPFDNSTNGFTSTDAQAAIEELNDTISVSASPGFSLGRSGNTPTGTWLLRTGAVPSNKTGIPVRLTNASIVGVSVGNENISSFDVDIYEHEGDEINLTFIGTVSVVASRTGVFSVSWPITSARQLAAKISSGSAKNPGVDLQLQGEAL